jgi:group I intron endonuclease
MLGYIYKTTNLLNNKIYVGQHLAAEFDENYKGSGVMLTRAFKKHGKENFTCVLLEAVETKEDLNSREIFWIDKLNSRDPRVGYNITAGGEGTIGYIHTEEAKTKMSRAKKGKPLTDAHKKAIGLASKGHSMSNISKEKLRESRLGTKHTDETRRKMHEAHQKNPKVFTEDYRRKLRESRAKALADGTWSISEEGMAHLRESGSRQKTVEHCQHISETRINSGVAAGAKNPRAKKIYCVETNTVYSWAGEAAEALGLSIHSIRRCRQGKVDNVKGYHFKDFID